jgi:hypothetical protein
MTDELEKISEDYDFNAESEALEKELETYGSEIDRGFEALLTSHRLLGAIRRFQHRVASVRRLALNLTDDKKDHFLRGTLYAGLVTAYECCVRDVLLAALEDDALVQHALKVISQRTHGKFTRRLAGMKAATNKNDLAKALIDSTLTDANLVDTVASKLFDLPMVAARGIKQHIQKRHKFVHNAGATKDDQYCIISLADLADLEAQLDNAAASYINQMANIIKKKIPSR